MVRTVNCGVVTPSSAEDAVHGTAERRIGLAQQVAEMALRSALGLAGPGNGRSGHGCRLAGHYQSSYTL